MRRRVQTNLHGKRGTGAAWVVLAVVCSLAASPFSSGDHQVESTAFNYDIESVLTSHATVIAEGDNAVFGTIVNEGTAPIQVWAQITAVYPDGSASSPLQVHTLPAGPDGRVTVTWDWEGPNVVDVDTDEVELTFMVWVERGDGTKIEGSEREKTIQRDVIRNDFNLEVAWERGGAINRGEESMEVALLEVTNTGNTRDAMKILLDETPPGWSFQFFPEETTLDPDGSILVSLRATAPKDTQYVGTNATLPLSVHTMELRVDDNPLRDQLSVTTPTVVNGTSPTVDIQSPIQQAPPGYNVYFDVEVSNPTAEEQEIHVIAATLSGQQMDDFTPSIQPSEATLAPGDERVFNITVAVPWHGFAGERVWTVTTTNQTTFEDVRLIQVVVPKVHFAPNLTLGSGPIQPILTPGETAQFPLSISHFSNYEDEICIETPDREDWSMQGGCHTFTPHPSSGDTIEFPWNITLEPWATGGDTQITFHAKSTSTGFQSDNYTLDLVVLNRTHAVLSSPLRSIPPTRDASGGPSSVPPFTPGSAQCMYGIGRAESLTFPVQARNDGNTDGTFTLAIAEVESGWDVNVPVGDYVLDGNRSGQSVNVGVRSPGTLQPGDVGVFRLNLTDRDDPSSTHVHECRFEAAYPDLAITPQDPLSDPEDMYAGHDATLDFLIANVGWSSTDDDVFVETVINGPSGKQVVRVTDRLDALETWDGDWWTDLSVDFTPTVSGVHTFQATVDPNGEISEPDGEPNMITGTFDVLDHGIVADAPAGMEAFPSQHITFEGSIGENHAFSVTNDGPGTHTLNVSLEIDPAWAPGSYQTVTLGPGDTHSMDYAFTVPSEPLVGEAIIKARVTNTTLDTQWVEDIIRIAIIDDEPPQISNLSANATQIPYGTLVGFTVGLHDTTGIDQAHLIIVTPDGETRSEVLQGASPVGEFHADATFEQVGVHTVHVWAQDRSTDHHSNQTTASTGSIEIDVFPTDHPAIQLVTPESARSIQPGTPIVLSFLGQAPITEATYQVDSAAATDLPITNPIQIMTDDWSDGEHAVSIHIEDSLGAEAHENFTFNLDGTAPTIQAISIPDAEPGEEVEVTARVEDAVNVTSVTLRLGTEDGTAKDHAMQHENGTTWSADITVPTGLVSLSVIAFDDAGNRAYAERSIDDETLHGGDPSGESPGTRPTPTVVAPITIALVALVAAMVRWRSMQR